MQLFLVAFLASSFELALLCQVVRLFKLAKHHGGSMQNEGNVTHLMSFLRHPALFRSYSQQWVYFGDLDVAWLPKATSSSCFVLWVRGAHMTELNADLQMLRFFNVIVGLFFACVTWPRKE